MPVWSNATNTYLSTNAEYSYENCNTVFQIDNKDFISNNDIVLIRTENNFNVICFEIDRYFNGIDLSDKKIEVWYGSNRFKSLPDIYNNYLIVDNCLVVNPQISDDYKLRFMWILNGNSTAINGKLDFCIKISNFDSSYIFLTKIQTLNVNNTIDPSASVVQPNNWYNEFNTAVNSMNSATNAFNANAHISFEIDNDGHLIVTSPLIQ